MTDTILQIRWKFSKCLAQLRYQENRIVAKPIRSPRSISNRSLDNPFHYSMIPRWFSQGNSATKACSTLLQRKSFQLLQNQAKTLLIGGIPADKAGRVNS